MALAARDRAAAGKGMPRNRRARKMDAMGGRICRPPLGISRRKCFSPCWTEDGWALLRRWRALFAEVTRAVPDSAASGWASSRRACVRSAVCGCAGFGFQRVLHSWQADNCPGHRALQPLTPTSVGLPAARRITYSEHTTNHALLRVRCRRSEPSHVQTHCIITHHLARIA